MAKIPQSSPQNLQNAKNPQALIKQIPRNAAYRDMLHALTSGFLPHVWIDVQVKKSRSYRGGYIFEVHNRILFVYS